MNTFVNAVINQESRTENRMKAFASTSSAPLDFFYAAGALRGKSPISQFQAAFQDNNDLAVRIALWARDARGGAGEREVFRNVVRNVMSFDSDLAIRMLARAPELGRWDDVLIGLESSDQKIKDFVFEAVKQALDAGNGLTAKWMPRKGPIAVQLREAFEWTPKYYRKRLVELTNVVETKMCAKEWDKIDYSKIPSLAHSRYKKAFIKHSPEAYSAYAEGLSKGVGKVNAGAVFPYDVLKNYLDNPWHINTPSKTEREVTVAQWAALPNYVPENASILPLVDVSGSMQGAYGKGTLAPISVSISLGLYLAEKNTGPFKDTFLTFSSTPELFHLKGDVVSKLEQMANSNWGGSTDLHRAMEKILKTAIDGKVPQEEMPKTLLILSDMQFNFCIRYDDSAMQMITRKYQEAGYDVPQVVFWNLRDARNKPAKANDKGIALVSGASPAIVQSFLKKGMASFDPTSIMMETILKDRYDY